MGFAKLSVSPPTLVSPYLTFSPLPGVVTPAAQLRRGRPRRACHVNAQRAETGGLFSVALSLGSPPVGVTDHPALRCSDFPPGFVTPAAQLRRGKPQSGSPRRSSTSEDERSPGPLRKGNFNAIREEWEGKVPG